MNQPNDPGDQSPQPIPITLVVYRELRIGMAVIMVMLSAAIIIDRMSAPRWQMALSEYFYTSAHSVFIAALLALSTLFFVYKGRSDTEDAFLTLAGVCTFTAALVPQGPPEVFGKNGLPEDYPVKAVILPNVSAVVVALVLGWLLALVQYRLTHTPRTRSPGGTLALYFLRLVVAVALIALICFPDKFVDHAHGAAGVLMLLSFIAAVFSAAYAAEPEPEPEPESKTPPRRFYPKVYRGIAWLMLVTLFAVVTLHIVLPHLDRGLWILVLETSLILEFAAFWVVQSIELWNTPDPRERVDAAARRLCADGQTKPGISGLKDELDKARKRPRGERLIPLL